MVNLEKAQNLIELLEQVTSLAVVQEFLKSKALSHSAGSWHDMRNKRLWPAIEDRLISVEDLTSLLCSAEECGRQHVFLYCCSKEKAAELMNRERVSNILSSKNLSHLLEQSDILLQPDVPTIADVRWETANIDLNMVIKEIETKEYRKFDRTEINGGYLYRIYEYHKQRAVNVAKLHASGMLEIRLASNRNTSKYDSDLSRFLLHIQDFIPLSAFSEISLTKAKDTFWKEREKLGELIRYTDATVCDGDGNILHAATGSVEKDLSENANIGKSLDLLIEEDGNAYCSDANLWFRKSRFLSTEIHILLDGAVNEFAIPANCTQGDYQYVLDQIRHYNR